MGTIFLRTDEQNKNIIILNQNYLFRTILCMIYSSSICYLQLSTKVTVMQILTPNYPTMSTERYLAWCSSWNSVGALLISALEFDALLEMNSYQLGIKQLLWHMPSQCSYLHSALSCCCFELLWNTSTCLDSISQEICRKQRYLQASYL